PAGFGRPLSEALDLAAGVHDPLRPRVEGMAGGANLRPQLLAGRARGEGIPADAVNDRVLVKGWMYLSFHVSVLLEPPRRPTDSTQRRASRADCPREWRSPGIRSGRARRRQSRSALLSAPSGSTAARRCGS